MKQELYLKCIRIAELTDRKFYLQETKYKMFVNKMNISEEHKQKLDSLVITSYPKATKEGALFLDHNSIYGGYRLDYFCNTSGRVDHLFTASRWNLAQFNRVLDAFIDGMNLANEIHMLKSKEVGNE